MAYCGTFDYVLNWTKQQKNEKKTENTKQESGNFLTTQEDKTPLDQTRPKPMRIDGNLLEEKHLKMVKTTGQTLNQAVQMAQVFVDTQFSQEDFTHVPGLRLESSKPKSIQQM